MSENNLSQTRRTVLKTTGATVVASTVSGVGSAATDPSNVSAELLYLNQSAGFDNSDFDHALIRVYEADTATDADVKSVGSDVARMLANFSTLDGYRVEGYSTNISGLEDCMDTSGCDPYQHGRDYVVELGHHNDGGGNIFIHDGDGGGTYGGVNKGNYVTMNYYNDDNKGPVSIKTPKTLTGKNGQVHWHACHEVAHQLHGDSSNWDSDYGTYYCGSSNGRKGHYLTTVRSDNRVTVMSAPGRGGQWNCGDCSSSYTDQYASVLPSSCLESATKDAIDYAKNTL